MAEPDPIRDFIADLFVDVFAGDKKRPPGDGVDDLAARRFLPVSPFFAALAALAYAAQDFATKLPAENWAQVAAVFDRLHSAAGLLIVLALVAVAVDTGRFHSHRHRVTVAAQLRQTTGHRALGVRVPMLSRRSAVKSARIKLPVGAVIRPKQMDEFTAAVANSVRGSTWTMNVSHEAHKDRLMIARALTVADQRSVRHKALAGSLEGASILKDAKVSVYSYGDDGVETGYRIGFTPNLNSGSGAFQFRVNEALIAIAGEHESGQNWDVQWAPDAGELLLTLKAPLPTRVSHPAPSELTSIAGRYLPYATGAAGAVAYWDVSTKSNKPHCLIVGPTGGGKTSAIRTILTEASLRGIPFIGVDPKMIELDGLRGVPRVRRDRLRPDQGSDLHPRVARGNDGAQPVRPREENRTVPTSVVDRGPRRVLHPLGCVDTPEKRSRRGNSHPDRHVGPARSVGGTVRARSIFRNSSPPGSASSRCVVVRWGLGKRARQLRHSPLAGEPLAGRCTDGVG